MSAAATAPVLAVPFAAVLDVALRGALLLAGAALVVALLHRRSAALRHAVWAGALAAHLALPLLALVAPAWRVSLDGAPGWLVAAAAGPAPVAVTGETASTTAPATAPAAPPVAPPVALPVALPAPDTPAPRSVVAPTPPAAAPPARAWAARSTGELLTALWLAGAALVLARLALGTLGVWRLARRGARVDDGRWLALAQRTAGRLGISRPTTLLKGGTLGVPVTWGIVYPVVLLPAEADGWDAERRRYVLVHELAHVRRFDALTQLVAQLAVAVFWFNPLVWYAAARMRLEREHACDDYVLREGTPASRYADDLLTMVRALGTPAHRAAEPAFAALAMARRSEFEGRMLAILDAHHDRHPLTRRGTAMLAAALLALGLPLAALTPAPTRATTTATTSTVAVRDSSSRAARGTTVRVDTGHAAPTPAAAVVRTSSDSGTARAAGAARTSTRSTRSTTPSCSDPQLGRRLRGTHILTSSGDGRRQLVEFVFNDAGRCAEATILGAVSFTPDERDVAALAPGGMASFLERAGGREWSLRITANGAGALAREVTRDGRPAPYDDAARAWLAGFLPEVLREAAIDAPGRVARLRAQGGVPAVLADIGRIRSSGAKRAHYEALLDEGTLSGADAERVTRQAAGDLSSSGDLSAVLQKVPRRALTTPGARAAVGDAVGRISSSGDRREALERLAPTADRDLLLRLAEAARGLPSSGDKAEFLRSAASYYLTPDDDELRAAYFGVATTVPSSGDLRDVLMHALPFARAEPGVTEAVLDAVGRIASGGDRSDVLVAVAEARLLTTRALRDAYVRAAEALPSGGDRARVLAAALEQRI